MIAKPTAIKDTGGKCRGCGWKAIEVKWGDLLHCHGIVSEGEAIYSDRATEVSSGHISRESDEGPNSKGATSRTQDSMSDKRQKNQLVLAFTEEGRREAPKDSQEGTASRTAKYETERPASHEQWMVEISKRTN